MKSNKSLLSQLKKWTAIMTIPMCMMACQGTGTSSSTTTSSSSTTSTTFPTSLAIASPTDYVSSSSSTSNARYTTSSSVTSYYAWATGRIDQILEGTATPSSMFDPELFLTEQVNADCFGPAVDYEDHPDGTGTEDGELPTGDLGLWFEEDDATSKPCSQAQLETRMESIRDGSTAALTVLASLGGVATANSISLPDSTTPSVDLLAEMNAAGFTDTTFTEATVTYDSSTGAYSYDVAFTYAPGSDSYDMVVAMTHTPSSTVGAYTGVVSYLVNDSFSGGNCSSSDVTRNGSIQYNRTSDTEIAVQVRQGMFCGHDSDGRDSDGIVDPSDKYDATSNPNGWGNSFDIFTANYDPQTLAGNYSYAWQAGPNDSNSRIFNLTGDASTSTANAYFGYGDDIEDTDGSILGFICNWAGPGSSHTLIESAQHQELSIDTSTGVATATSSSLAYAPTNSCDYDGSSSFVFDIDDDNDLTDEDSSTAVNNELLEGSDIDGDSTASIEEVIEDAGFTVPTI